MPNIDFKNEFLAANSKSFVLLKGSNLIHGNWDTWFTILKFNPMENDKSYTHYPLLLANEDPVSGMSGGNYPSTWDNDAPAPLYISKGQATTIRSYKVFNEGTNNLYIVFNINEEDCNTLEKISYKKIFILSNGKFVEK